MRKPRLSVFNIVQLVVTVVAVMFGIYGFMVNAGPATNQPVVANLADENAGPLDSGEACSPLDIPEQPEPGPAWHPKPSPPPSIQHVASDPDDKGNAKLKGSVKFTDGSAVDGVEVTAISTQCTPASPAWDVAHVDETRTAYDRYFRELERNTRVTTTDATGHFRFEGLDSKHAYRVTINDPEIGVSTQTVAAGSNVEFKFDVPVLIDGKIVCEGGEVPASFSVSCNVDNGQGWFQNVSYGNFSDPDGKFRIRGKTGKAQLIVSAQGWIQDTQTVLQLEKKGAECEIKLVRGASLSGLVTSGDGAAMQSVTVTVAGKGNPVQNAWGRGDYDGRYDEEVQQLEQIRKILKDTEEVEILEKASLKELSSRAMPGWSGNLAGYTGVDGRYRIEGIKPGTWTVTASYGTITTSREITLKSGENFADFTLDSGNRVKLTARDSGGNKVNLNSAWFTDSKGGYAQVNQLPVTTAGEIEYIGVKEGTWTVNAGANGFPNVQQEVTVLKGSNSFEIVFEEPASLSGHISSGSGKIPANLYVRLTPKGNDATKDDREYRRRSKMAYSGGQTAAVDAKGDYTINSVQPGEYTFSVQFNQNDELYSCDITLAAGKQTQDATIDERCTVVVTVTLAPEIKSTEGLAVTISKTDSTKGDYVSRYGKLDDSNRCEFSFLPEGEYYVMVYGKDGTQTYETVSVMLGTNNVSLSVGPPNCVKITQVVEGYQGAEAGIKVGDLVIEYNGASIKNMDDLVKEVQSTKEDDSLTIVVVRNGTTLSFRLNGGRIGINGNNYRR